MGIAKDIAALATAKAKRAASDKIQAVTGVEPSKKGIKKKIDEMNPYAGDIAELRVVKADPGPCMVNRYLDLKDSCPPGQQAHHIIPDTLNRTSNRKQGAKGIGRIPGMPSLDDGPCICLTGQARVPKSEHNVAHGGDRLIRNAANRTDNGVVGTLPVKEAIPISMAAAIKARPDCEGEIRREVRRAYPDYENDNRSMNGSGRPPKGAAKAHLENGGVANNNTQGPKPRARRK